MTAQIPDGIQKSQRQWSGGILHIPRKTKARPIGLVEFGNAKSPEIDHETEDPRESARARAAQTRQVLIFTIPELPQTTAYTHLFRE